VCGPATCASPHHLPTHQYNKYCIYFVAELLKFSVAAGWTAWKYHVDLDGRKFIKASQRDVMQ
jgi:hypothetical protein